MRRDDEDEEEAMTSRADLKIPFNHRNGNETKTDFSNEPRPEKDCEARETGRRGGGGAFGYELGDDDSRLIHVHRF